MLKESIFIEKYEDIKKFPVRVQFYCENCGKLFEKEFRRTTKPKLLCTVCNINDGKSKRTIEQKLESNNKRHATIERTYGSFDNYISTLKAKSKETNISKYGVENVFQSQVFKEKSKQTKLEKYGNEHYVNPDKAKETKIELYGAPTTLQSECLLDKVLDTKRTLYGEHYEKIVAKIKYTKLEKYGDENYNNSEKNSKTCLERFGVEHPLQNKDIQKKSVAKYMYDNEFFDSSWELALWIYAHDHNENIIHEPRSFKYEFDGKSFYYYPDFTYKGQLLEIKGEHFFNGEYMCNPYDHTLDAKFEAKHKCGMSNGVVFWGQDDVQFALDYVNTKYTKDYLKLFRLGLPFPYLNPNLTDTTDMGIIHHFHKSIYGATRKGKKSPIQAWNDKDIIKKVALNRLKYVGRCRPSDILQGFNVTRIANKVSVFKPSLAEHIINTYLSESDTIVDPFSGFSGRLLGSKNCSKSYVGFDINDQHVKESNDIIRYLKLNNIKVCQQDLLSAPVTDWFNTKTSLFTCPPYGDKEHWDENNDEVELSCDEWIDICLKKHVGCEHYVFVVDKTEKYKDKIVETLINKSHFGASKEYVLSL